MKVGMEEIVDGPTFIGVYPATSAQSLGAAGSRGDVARVVSGYGLARAGPLTAGGAWPERRWGSLDSPLSPGRSTPSQALPDEQAVLACLAYLDLNPVRAAIAETRKDSDYTSIQRRIRTLHGASECSADGETAERDIAPASTQPPSCTPSSAVSARAGPWGCPSTWPTTWSWSTGPDGRCATTSAGPSPAGAPPFSLGSARKSGWCQLFAALMPSPPFRRARGPCG